MKRWILAAFVLALGIFFGVRGGAWANETGTEREKVSLKDAFRRVVKGADVDPRNAKDGQFGAASDSISAEDQELLDEVLLSPEPYYYQAFGRRDPFISLVPDANGASPESGLFGPGDIVVVGILWGDRDRFALVEAVDGTCAILRVGDRFRNATVTEIQKDQVVLYVTNYGIGRTLTLPLTEGKASNDERGRGNR